MTGLRLADRSVEFAEPVDFAGVPSARLELCVHMCSRGIHFYISSWLMSVYTRDILSRLPQLLASCTAVFGSTLKLDSTKKVCKKLQGTAAGSASWCTNMGNEREEVLVSVLTESEGLEGLRPMAMGLIERLFGC